MGVKQSDVVSGSIYMHILSSSQQVYVFLLVYLIHLYLRWLSIYYHFLNCFGFVSFSCVSCLEKEEPWARLSFRFDRKVKSFLDKGKLGEFITTTPALQVLKELLWAGNPRERKDLPKIFKESCYIEISLTIYSRICGESFKTLRSIK